MVFGRCTPGRAGIVDQNVHIAHALQGLIGQAGNFVIFGAICSDPACVDARSLQFSHCGLQVCSFA